MTKVNKGGLLMPPPKGPFKQNKVDGSGVLKQTAPKEIQDAADYWFGKKEEEARSKDNVKKAAESVLKLMEKAKITTVLVFNSTTQSKWRVNILQGAEKLKIEKNVTD